MQNKVSDGGKRPGTGADAAAILVERDIAHIVQPVLDGPVGAR